MKKITFLLLMLFGLNTFSQTLNDLPCVATSLNVNETCINQLFSFDGTETDSNVGVPNCSLYSGQDRWYQFVMPPDGMAVSIKTSYASGDFYDTALEVFYTDGDCNNLIYLGCDDDGNRVDTGSNNDFFSQIDVVRPIGSTVYFRVWHYEVPKSGDFNLCLYKIDPPIVATNNECNLASDLIAGPDCSSPSLTTNFGATASTESDPSCTPNEGNDVWYKITLDDLKFYDVTIETSEDPGSAFSDTALAIYTATNPADCGAGLTEIDCNDDIDPFTDNYFSRVNLTGRRNEVLFVRVYPAFIAQTGTFNICATKTETLGVVVKDLNLFSMYPNPAKDILNLKFNQITKNEIDINIYNIQGKLILKNNQMILNNSTQIDVSTLKSGMYFLKINDGIRELTNKLIIK